jgi:hypothetical protein
MQIDINQIKLAKGETYQVFLNGQQSHFVTEEVDNYSPVINLYDIDDGRLKIVIKKRLSLVFARFYDIVRWDNSIVEFRTKSIWRLHYQCQCGSDAYDIYEHNNQGHFVYRNNSQVAWWDKDAWYNKKISLWLSGRSYKMIAEDDCDIDLVISFCLIVDSFPINNDTG